MHTTDNPDIVSQPAKGTGHAASGLNANDIVMEGFILLAMALATLAIGTALYLQFNLSFAAALACALSLYLGLLATHALVHRNSAVAALKAELVGLERQIARAAGNAMNASGRTKGLQSVAPAPAPLAAQTIAAQTTTQKPETQTFNAQNQAPKRDDKPADETRPPPLDIAAPLPGDPLPAAPLSIPEGGYVLAGGQVQKGTPPTLTTTLPPARPPRESDVAMIQGLIKKLADEVNDTEKALVVPPLPTAMPAHGDQQDGATESTNSPAAPTLGDNKTAGPVTIASQVIASQSLPTDEPEEIAVQTPDTIQTPDTPPATVHAPETSPSGPPADPIEDSVNALRTAADAMRHLDDHAADNAASAEPDTSADPGTFAIISQALSTGRVDVLLDPILGLDNRRARHFEISLRLRDIDNSLIDTSEPALGLAGTGLSTLLDRATLSRTATVAVQLDSRGRQGAVFSKVTAHSFAQPEFIGDLHSALREHERLSGQLVMTISQAHVRALGSHEWAVLNDLKDLGFRFAVSSITDLDMDFYDLGEKGFAFVKLDAEVFLNGLLADQTRIPASDICSHFAASGHTVIIEHLDDDTVLDEVKKFGVEFGQGQLFGGPRTVKAQALQSKSATAAA